MFLEFPRPLRYYSSTMRYVSHQQSRPCKAVVSALVLSALPFVALVLRCMLLLHSWSILLSLRGALNSSLAPCVSPPLWGTGSQRQIFFPSRSFGSLLGELRCLSVLLARLTGVLFCGQIRSELV